LSNVNTLARQLLDLRRGKKFSSEDTLIAPLNETEAYHVQDIVARDLGPICGWKVGASSSSATPAAAPLHAASIFTEGDTLPASTCRFLGVEVELAFRLGSTLNDSSRIYTRADILDAVASVHTALEILDTRFAEPNSQHPLLHFADQQNHGALIVGPALPDWRSHTFEQADIRLTIDGKTAFNSVITPPPGDVLRLLVWLANHACQRGIPLKDGDIVTTGSLSGTIYVPHGTSVLGEIADIGRIAAFLE
jgi:2-keto-4-pentenoate hydratase